MVSIEQRLQPFRIPNYVLFETQPRSRGEGFKETPKLHLRDVPESTLLEMCEQFKKDVLKKHKSKATE